MKKQNIFFTQHLKFATLVDYLAGDQDELGCDVLMPDIALFEHKKPKCLIHYKGNQFSGNLFKCTEKKLMKVSEILKAVTQFSRKIKKEKEKEKEKEKDRNIDNLLSMPKSSPKQKNTEIKFTEAAIMRYSNSIIIRHNQDINR